MDETTQTNYTQISSEVTTANAYLIDNKYVIAKNIDDALKAWRMWYYPTAGLDSVTVTVEPDSIKLIASDVLVFKNYDPAYYKTRIANMTTTE